MKPQIFRSTIAWVLGWLWMAFAAFNAVDLILNGRIPSALVAGAVLAVLTAAVYIGCLRPGILPREDGILVRNPLRNIFIPWKAVDNIHVSHAIVIESGDESVRCWTPQSSARERAKATRRGTTVPTPPAATPPPPPTPQTPTRCRQSLHRPHPRRLGGPTTDRNRHPEIPPPRRPPPPDHNLVPLSPGSPRRRPDPGDCRLDHRLTEPCRLSAVPP